MTQVYDVIVYQHSELLHSVAWRSGLIYLFPADIFVSFWLRLTDLLTYLLTYFFFSSPLPLFRSLYKTSLTISVLVLTLFSTSKHFVGDYDYFSYTFVFGPVSEVAG